MSESSGVTVLGSINMDLFVHAERLPVSGETLMGKTFKEFAGGKGANQAVAIAKLGGVARMVGCIGDDSFATTLRANLRHNGVDTEHVRVAAGAASGIASIWVDAQGENRIVVIAGANALVGREAVDAAFATISVSQFLLMQLECPLATVIYALERVAALRAAGLQTVLNPAPAVKLSPEVLRAVDILIPNETELAQLTDLPVSDVASARRAARRLLTMGSSKVVVTLGERGALYVAADEEVYQAAVKVVATDTTAAGDSFIGAYLSALTQGHSNAEAMAFAAQAAALTITRAGAQDAIPRAEEVNAFCRAQ